LLDSSGNVIGIVAAKLDAVKVKRTTGDVPQNINFAIELGVLKKFLREHGVRTKETPLGSELRPADIGDRARLFTYLIQCETPSTMPSQAQTLPGLDHSDIPSLPSSGPLKSISVDPKSLKVSDLRRPYPSLRPEIFEINISNPGSEHITELVIGFMRTQDKPCSWKFNDYDGIKRFAVNLPTGDSVTLTGEFSAQVKRFCIVRALGPPGREACSTKVSSEIGIAGCTRTIESGEVQGFALGALYNHRGAHWLTKGEFGRAIQDFDEAIRLNSKDELAYRLRGYSYAKNGNVDGAIADTSEAIRLSPKDLLAHLVRGLSFNKKSEYDHAIADLSEAIRLGADDRANTTIAYGGRADAYFAKGDYERAIVDYTRAIQFNPKFAVKAYVKRGLSHEKKGELEQALADFRAALEVAPTDNAAADGILRVEKRARQ
jgi:Tfp pilus assembly protein PilF